MLRSLIIIEMQIKITMRHHLMLVWLTVIKKSTNNKCWRGCVEKETLLHCLWQCTLVQPRWRTVWRFLKKWEQNCHTTQQSHCWAYTLRQPELKETHVDPSVHCSTVTIARIWKQSRCSLTEEWIRKLWYIYTMEYSVQLLSHVWLFATPWFAAHQASLFITNSWSSLKLMSIKSVMPSSHLILCCPLTQLLKGTHLNLF